MAPPRVRRGSAGISLFSDWFPDLVADLKMAVARFDIEIRALSSAVVGALLAAKTALILDETPLARHLEHYRRIVAVAVKSSLYGVITLLLGCLERVLEAHHRLHSFDAAVQDVIGQASLSRLLAWALGVTLVFGLYFAFSEINERMGAEELWNLFFESPKIAGKSSQPVVPVGNVRN
jgi:hypothetical protein